jgi:hypothetical protein
MKKRISHVNPQPKTILVMVCSLFFSVSSIFAQTWAQTSAPTNQEWDTMACSADGSTVLAVGQTAVYTSTNSGTTWAPAQVPPPFYDNNWRGAAVSADGVTMAAGDYGDIYISTNSGLTWLLSTNAPTNYWFSIACSADGTKLVAAPYYDTASGNPQPLYLSTNSGTTWTAALTPSNHWTAVASSADGTKLIALVANGPIYLSTNSGTSWTSNNTVAYWTSVACSADGIKAVAVANPGEVYITTNSGVNWPEHNVLGSGNGFGSVASSADGTRLLVAGYEAPAPFFVSTNSGVSWVKQTNAPPIASWNAVASSADGHKTFAATYGFVVNDNAGGIYALQTIPSPELNLTSGTSPTISWTVPSTNFVLQQNPDLTTTNWTDVTNVPVLDLTNLLDEVMVPLTNGSGFYRLVTP